MIRIGLVGYGYWGPNIARCVADAEGSALAAIADASPDARAKAAKRHPGVALHESWQDLIKDPLVDAVSIATPVGTHFEIALAALKAGKHVIVEKPMTRTAKEAAILIQEAARRRLTLMVGHTFVYTGAVQKIRDLLSLGVIGDVYYYDSTRINLGLFQRDVNVIWDLAVHDMAILDFILDAEPVAISCNGTGHFVGRPENMAQMTLFFSSGTVAHLNVNWLAPVKVRQTLIAGSSRMIVYDDLEPSEKVKVYDRGIEMPTAPEEIHQLRVSYRVGDMWAPQLAIKEALLTEIEHFVSCVTDGLVPLTSGESGLKVVKMLEASMLSLKQRGHPVELTPLRRAS